MAFIIVRVYSFECE